MGKKFIDADRGTYGVIRAMVNCNQKGEATGVTCSLAFVDAEKLRKTPCEEGLLTMIWPVFYFTLDLAASLSFSLAITATSTLRFAWRPSTVSFEAIGWTSPYPMIVNRLGSTWMPAR